MKTNCSMQYHELKKETIIVLNGELKVYIGQDINNLEEKILRSVNLSTIEPFTIHSFVNLILTVHI